MSKPQEETTRVEELGTGFADLSAELRSNIYRLALVLPSSLQLVRAFHKTQGTIFILHPDQVKSLTPQILRTNKQIYSEATSILYGENTFRFRYESWLTVFLPKQIPHSVQHLRRIEIVDLNDCFSTTANFLKPVKNLESLVLRCDMIEAVHSAEAEDAGGELGEEEFEALLAAGLIQTEEDDEEDRFKERSEREVDDEKIMPTASYTAKKLKPLAQAIYDVQKDKKKVIGIFRFKSWDWLTDELFETKAAKKLGTKVAECLSGMIESPTCQSGAGGGEAQGES